MYHMRRKRPWCNVVLITQDLKIIRGVRAMTITKEYIFWSARLKVSILNKVVKPFNTKPLVSLVSLKRTSLGHVIEYYTEE
jgi:hypothetical protein